MPTSLTLEEFSDIDLFFAIEDAAGGPDDWATSEEISQQIGLGASGTGNVGIRLGWSYRFGLVEKRKKDGRYVNPAEWRMNNEGYALMHPDKLPVAVEKALKTLDEGQRAQVTDAVVRALPRSSRQAAHMGRRIFNHHMAAWRDPRIAAKRKSNGAQ